MKNVILPIILIALLAECVKREETMVGGIYGTVKDAETAQPLAGCSVMLMPGGMTIVTGEDGAFHFEDVLPDTYSLEASCYGYYSNKKSIVVMAGESPMAVDVLLTRYDPNNRLAELGAMTVGEVTFRSARFQCEVIDQGSSSVTERGFLYSETPNVTIATATKKAVNTTDAIFSMTVTGLAEETDYYVTAYAINGQGTAYSDVVTFRTGSASGVTAPTNVVYVSVTGDDGNDGTSWTKAKKTIDAAVECATAGKQVWVSTGSYKESVKPKDGVPVYGGFEGDETTVEARTGRTTVAGVDCEDYTTETVVDGFEVVNGNPWEAVVLGENARLVNCHIRNNEDKAIAVASGEAGAVIENCIVEGNGADMAGGSIVVDIDAKATFVNCFIRGNKEGIWNEGVLLMYNCVVSNNGWGVRSRGRTELYNCTVVANGSYGIAAEKDAILYNCVIWNNRVLNSYLGSSGCVNRYSCLEIEGADNSRTRFKRPSSSAGKDATDALEADWSIEAGSACINAGSTVYFPVEDYPTDIAGNARVTGEAIDIGAYEW